nr:hypothetical protein [Tanacetum cinerariifolium]
MAQSVEDNKRSSVRNGFASFRICIVLQQGCLDSAATCSSGVWILLRLAAGVFGFAVIFLNDLRVLCSFLLLSDPHLK